VNPTGTRETILRLLRDIAPEVDPSSLDPRADLRDELDLDSMDTLNLVTGIERELHVTVPESDYPQLRTVDGAVEYVHARRAAAS
jgi:acyl carrier protein